MRLEHCAVPICRAMLKVLDFSADNDHEPDSNGEYTSATIEAGPLPESFTICSAFMVDGQLLGEGEYKRDEDEYRPANLRLGLGFVPLGSFAAKENTGRVSELNIFNSSLSAERMKGLTTSGGEECGAPGDLVSWEEAEWTLHSQAKEVEVDREWEGPCRRESKVQVFTADFFRQDFCMHLCQKISGGRSPPVTTREEWESLTREVDLITRDRSTLPFMWISATEGYFPGNLGFDNTWLWPKQRSWNLWKQFGGTSTLVKGSASGPSHTTSARTIQCLVPPIIAYTPILMCSGISLGTNMNALNPVEEAARAVTQLSLFLGCAAFASLPLLTDTFLHSSCLTTLAT